MPKGHDGHSHSQCQPFTPTTPASYPTVFSLCSKKKTIQLTLGSDLCMMNPPQSMINTPLLPQQKTGLAFLWDQEISNGKSTHNLWATSPPGSTLNSRKIITKKFISTFELL
ncbi:hypothetical protein O181_035149 [Austropuccinia psidii MF-1]|uniref:Uncharacterized protein n=1 Tax=Austropuccinia psidii MF-1 TaxID=1389203 RepID=A0A9Q3D271_9BASI|nr:hypothetical protein [Austropuccinia psidii MF-1]